MSIYSLFENNVRTLLHETGIEINGSKPWDIRINDPGIFKDILLKGSLGFGDGYANGKWDVTSIDVFFEKLLQNQKVLKPSYFDYLHSIRNSFINSQIGRRAFHVAEQHYDLGNDMYGYMLGESMGYSSGKFLNKSDDLTKAQYQKFDAICKKLHLKPGMKVLEIGAGWGTFARHAARNYGVMVTGITVSVEQKKFAEQRCKGLPVSFVLTDYQNVSEKYNTRFDRVVSIEMIEAVGKKNMKTFFNVIERTLKPGGLLGLQAIIGTGEDDAFLSTRIFPNGHVPSAKEIVRATEGLLHIAHWESFGKDYDKTLVAWEHNFRKNWKYIKQLKDSSGQTLYDAHFYRMWRYYLLLCAATFRIGRNDVAQIIMSKPANPSFNI